MSELLYGRRNAGVRVRDDYDDAAGYAAGLSAMAGETRERAGGEALRGVLDTREMFKHLEDDTFQVRAAEAQGAIGNIQRLAGQMAAQVYAGSDAGAMGPGGGDVLGGLADVARWQQGAMAGLGGSMRQFRGQTMDNFRRRESFGRLMDAAGAAASGQLREWASLALSRERDDRQAARDDWRDRVDLQRMLSGEQRAARHASPARATPARPSDTPACRHDHQTQGQDAQPTLPSAPHDSNPAFPTPRPLDAPDKQRQGVLTAQSRQQQAMFDAAKRWASPKALQAGLAGDWSLAQAEYDALYGGGGEGAMPGQGGAMAGPGVRSRAGVTKTTKVGTARVRNTLKRYGYGLEGDDLAEFGERLPGLLEQYGGDEEAAAAAGVRLINPEQAFLGAAKGAGANDVAMTTLVKDPRYGAVMEMYNQGYAALERKYGGQASRADLNAAALRHAVSSVYGEQYFGQVMPGAAKLIAERLKEEGGKEESGKGKGKGEAMPPGPRGTLARASQASPGGAMRESAAPELDMSLGAPASVMVGRELDADPASSSAMEGQAPRQGVIRNADGSIWKSKRQKGIRKADGTMWVPRREREAAPVAVAPKEGFDFSRWREGNRGRLAVMEAQAARSSAIPYTPLDWTRDPMGTLAGGTYAEVMRPDREIRGQRAVRLYPGGPYKTPIPTAAELDAEDRRLAKRSWGAFSMPAIG